MTKINPVVVIAFAYSLLNANQLLAANLLSLEGGGFRAMVAESGLIAGVIKHKNTSSENLLSKLDAVSGNSGGTWFTTCLAYSPEFVDSLEHPEDFFSANKGGYMGLVGKAYQDYFSTRKPVNNDVALNQFVGKLERYSGSREIPQYLKMIKYHKSGNTGFTWKDVLAKTVFQPYQTASRIQQASFKDSLPSRTRALPTQAIVFEAALSTNGAGIGRFDVANETLVTALNVGVDKTNHPYIFTAASITSLGVASGKSAPSLPTQEDGSLNIIYSSTTSKRNATPATSSEISLPNVNFDGISILSATAASSSAGGLLDSAGSLYSHALIGLSKFPNALVNNLINAGQEFAVPVIVDSITGTISDFRPDQPSARVETVSPEDLASHPMLRLVDGGYIDNTGLTSGLSYLHENRLLHDGFNLTVFTTLLPLTANDQGLGAVKQEYNVMSPGVRNLFTQSRQFQTAANFSISHRSAAVFDSTSTTGLANPIWKYADPLGFLKLKYYRLGVTTAQNNFDIPSGLHGTLNVWVVHTPATVVALPGSDGPASWKQYDQLFSNIVKGLQASYAGKTGADLLMQNLSGS